MSDPMGKWRWAIAEGYIPFGSNVPEPQFTSHETACLLNTSDEDAHVEITAYFSDREPAGPYHVTVPARRTLHVRFNGLFSSLSHSRNSGRRCCREQPGVGRGPNVAGAYLRSINSMR